jgi:nickel-dependent lactate racemase
MPASLKYGASAILEIDLPDNALVANWTGPSADGQSAVAAATSAIQTPLDFPQLKQATVPGDHVVLALEPGVPQAPAVVAAIVPVLLSGGVAAEDITIVRTHADVDADQIDPRSALPVEQRNAVQLAVHEAGDEDQLAFLAADPKGEAIYLNRQMCEADLVIPIGYLRPDECANRSGRHGIWNSNVYPTFGDRKTIDHFSANGVPLTPGQLSHRQKQIDQVAWLLGVQVTAQVLPGTDDSAWQVLFGSPAAVFPQGWTMCRTAWQMDASRTANLVVAGIGGGPAQQTWANVGHALKTALPLVNDGGAVALCTELNSPLGPALRLIADSGDLESAAPRLRKLRSPDAEVARLLIESQDRVRIYLLSNLGEDVVEALGFGYIQSPTEITRLAKHHESCILLPDAQYGRAPTTN